MPAVFIELEHNLFSWKYYRSPCWHSYFSHVPRTPLLANVKTDQRFDENRLVYQPVVGDIFQTYQSTKVNSSFINYVIDTNFRWKNEVLILCERNVKWHRRRKNQKSRFKSQPWVDYIYAKPYSIFSQNSSAFWLCFVICSCLWKIHRATKLIHFFM